MVAALNNAKGLIFAGALSLGTVFASFAQDAGNDNQLYASNNGKPESGTVHDFSAMDAAQTYSATGQGIGLYILKGSEHDHLSNQEMISYYEENFAKKGVRAKVFIKHGSGLVTLYEPYLEGTNNLGYLDGKGLQDNLEFIISVQKGLDNEHYSQSQALEN